MWKHRFSEVSSACSHNPPRLRSVSSDHMFVRLATESSGTTWKRPYVQTTTSERKGCAGVLYTVTLPPPNFHSNTTRVRSVPDLAKSTCPEVYSLNSELHAMR